MPQKEIKARRKNDSGYSEILCIQDKLNKKEQSQKSRKRSVNRNRKYVESYKLKNPCSCGVSDPCCLSFHHSNGDKTGNISDMVNRGYGINRIKKEIEKCDILCLNCHAKLHNKEKVDKLSELKEKEQYEIHQQIL